MSRTSLVLAALAAVVFAAYSLGFSGPFLFDDYTALTANRLLQFDPAVFDQWRTAAASSRSGPLGRPVAMFSFALNYALAGDISAYWIKFGNALIHCGIGIVIYFLSLKLLRQAAPQPQSLPLAAIAVLAAAIWMLHPLHVSTVLYAVQRMAQLATLFMCLGVLVFVHYRARWAVQGAAPGEVVAAALWLVLLTLLAAYSKENGALLPLLLVVVEVCFFRGQWAGGPVIALRRGADLALLGAFAFVVMVVLLPPDFLEGRYARREFSLHERAMTQLRLLWHYLAWLALPNIGAMGFQHDDIPVSRGLLQPASTLLALLSWPLVLAAAARLRRRFPLLLFALLFYLAGHLVESSFWPLEMVYEHRNYLPSVGVCLLFASMLALPMQRAGQGRAARYALVCGVPVVLLALLLVRVDTWSDEIRLAGVNVRNHPESPRSNYFYANALLKQYTAARQEGAGREDAIESLIGARYYFERMYQTNPRDVAALVMLHSLDTRFAGAAPERTDWLQKLEDLLDSRVLQASDRNAIDALISCLNAGGCAADRERILAMLERLESRYPGNLTVLGWRFNYLLGQQADDQQINALIDEALSISPGRREYLYRKIQQQAKVNDVDGMYESVRLWLEYDRTRRFLHPLKALFTTGSNSPRENGP
ncbi:MAG: hypothetical protein NXI15_11390 [Gammaproteobacteria bacterium]|nr:hypothetical protein [Gammaproteobacteria bacterium]